MAKRKAKKRRSGKAKKPNLLGRLGKRGQMRLAGQWPLYECLMTKDWREEGELVQIAVVRRSPQGQIAVGSFLVDLGCLGVKNAMAVSFPTIGEYRSVYRRSFVESQEIVEGDLDLAAKIVQEGVKYADSLGFKPDKDIRDAYLIMGEVHPENCAIEIPVGGKDGRPFFFAGPYDNVERIMRTLDRKVGPGNYHFFAPLGDPMMFDDDEFDDWEDEDDNDV